MKLNYYISGSIRLKFTYTIKVFAQFYSRINKYILKQGLVVLGFDVIGGGQYRHGNITSYGCINIITSQAGN